MRIALSRVALAAVWIAALGCLDDGAVGTVVMTDCDPVCEPDETCDPMLNRCIDCEGNACEVPDECDDCSPTDAECLAMFCRPCLVDTDCSSDEPRCLAGRCVEADDDDDPRS